MYIITFLPLENIKDVGSFILNEVPNTKTDVRREFTISSVNVEDVNLVDLFRRYATKDLRIFEGAKSFQIHRPLF